MAARGEPQPQPAVTDGGDAGQHQGREAGVVGVEQRVVEQREQPPVLGLDQAQRAERVADLAGEDGGLQALAAHVAEDDGGLAARGGGLVRVVEVPADTQGVRGRPVGAGQLQALDGAQRGWQEVPLEQGGGAGLLAVQDGAEMAAPARAAKIRAKVSSLSSKAGASPRRIRISTPAGTPLPGSGVTRTEPGVPKPSGRIQSGACWGSIQREGTGGKPASASASPGMLRGSSLTTRCSLPGRPATVRTRVIRRRSGGVITTAASASRETASSRWRPHTCAG